MGDNSDLTCSSVFCEVLHRTQCFGGAGIHISFVNKTFPVAEQSAIKLKMVSES